MTNHVGGFACPICGLEYIHEHSPADIVRLHNLRKRAISIADFDAFSAWIEKRDMKTLHGRPVWAFELWLAAKDHYKAIPDEPSAHLAYHETHEAPHCPTCDCGLDALTIKIEGGVKVFRDGTLVGPMPAQKSGAEHTWFQSRDGWRCSACRAYVLLPEQRANAGPCSPESRTGDPPWTSRGTKHE